MKKLIYLFVAVMCISGCVVLAEDGTYDATVSTDSGSYSVPVEVENGEVTQVHWPNGGDMTVSGADISGDEATGVNSRGDSVTIELEDYKQESEESEE